MKIVQMPRTFELSPEEFHDALERYVSLKIGGTIVHLDPKGSTLRHHDEPGRMGIILTELEPDEAPPPSPGPARAACGERFVFDVAVRGQESRSVESTCNLPRGHLGLHAVVSLQNAVLATQGREVARCSATRSVAGGCMGYPDRECQLSQGHPGRHIDAEGVYFDAEHVCDRSEPEPTTYRPNPETLRVCAATHAGIHGPHVCGLELGHKGPHRDGAYEWAGDHREVR
jgi:hypothetical protein